MNQLESLLALQDKTLNDLNREVFRQQQDMGRLLRRIEMLEEKIREMGEPNQIAGNERPPHW